MSTSLPPAVAGSVTAVSLPPWHFWPYGSVAIELVTLPAVTIGAASALSQTKAVALSYKAPGKYWARFLGIGMGALNPTDTVFLSYTIDVNGDALQGYENIPAAMGSPRNLRPIIILLNPGLTLNVTVFNSTYKPVSAIVALQGYRYDPSAGGGA